jgi:hypothetical protein
MVVDPTCFTKSASPSLNDVILTNKQIIVWIPTIITMVLVMYITLYQYK